MTTLPPGVPPKPEPPAQLPPGKPGGCGTGCLVIIAVLIIAIVTGVIIASIKGKEPYDGNNSFEAVAQCEDRVKALLKAPATAEFGDTTATGSGTWTVTGTVDSENSFGAMLRARFQCTVTITGDTARTTVDYLK